MLSHLDVKEFHDVNFVYGYFLFILYFLVSIFNLHAFYVDDVVLIFNCNLNLNAFACKALAIILILIKTV